MVRTRSIRIQREAAAALAEWKAFFAEQVAVKAREFAEESSQPTLITTAQYRRAAVLAAEALAIELKNADASDGRQEAA